jgi:hypothetical protein
LAAQERKVMKNPTEAFNNDGMKKLLQHIIDANKVIGFLLFFSKRLELTREQIKTIQDFEDIINELGKIK